MQSSTEYLIIRKQCVRNSQAKTSHPVFSCGTDDVFEIIQMTVQQLLITAV